MAQAPLTYTGNMNPTGVRPQVSPAPVAPLAQQTTPTMSPTGYRPGTAAAAQASAAKVQPPVTSQWVNPNAGQGGTIGPGAEATQSITKFADGSKTVTTAGTATKQVEPGVYRPVAANTTYQYGAAPGLTTAQGSQVRAQQGLATGKQAASLSDAMATKTGGNAPGMTTAAGSAARTQQAANILATPQMAQAPVTVDPLSPTAETDIKLASMRAKANKQLQEFDATADANFDKYMQELTVQGVGGGSKNAFMGALYRENSSARNDLLFALAQEEMSYLADKDSAEQESMMNVLNGLAANGQVDQALSFAKEMAQLYPDSTFFNYLASSPNARNTLSAMLTPEAQAAKREQQTYAREQAALAIQDPFNTAAVNAAWPEFYQNWLKTFTGNTEAETAAQAWAKASPDTAAEIVRELTGLTNVNVSALPADVLAKAYIRNYYDNYVKNLQANQYGEDAMQVATRFTTDPQQLEMIKDAAAVIAQSTPRSVTIDGINVSNEAFTDTANGALSYLFTDWNGNDYDPASNPRQSVPGTEAYGLDTLWKAAISMLDSEGNPILDGITRQQFKDMVYANADTATDQAISTGAISPAMATQMLRGMQTAFRTQQVANTNDPTLIAKNALSEKIASGGTLGQADVTELATALAGMDDPVDRLTYLASLKIPSMSETGIPTEGGDPLRESETTTPRMVVLDGEPVLVSGAPVPMGDGTFAVRYTAQSLSGGPVDSWQTRSYPSVIFWPYYNGTTNSAVQSAASSLANTTPTLGF